MKYYQEYLAEEVKEGRMSPEEYLYNLSENSRLKNSPLKGGRLQNGE